MPTVPAVPPADRFFAVLGQFDCECPSCGKLIFSALDKRSLPTRLKGQGRIRRMAKYTPKIKQVWESVWNPYSQRLECPWCGRSFVAGLVLYPVRPRAPRPLDAPPDTVPDSRYLALLRQRAGGWLARQFHQRGQHVNLAVTSPCSCPEDRGWSASCPVHGDPDYPDKTTPA